MKRAQSPVSALHYFETQQISREPVIPRPNTPGPQLDRRPFIEGYAAA